jgi:formylglycine-generating enzyme required for sulfatase activity
MAQPHVFFSYVREDFKTVERLAVDLERCGIAVWLDRNDIRPGELWEQVIEGAIRSGAFFVACFSQAYVKRSSTHMNEELHLAVKQIRLRPLNVSWFIPLRLDECEIPDWPIAPGLSMRSFQWLDMFPDWEMSLERLTKELSAPHGRSETLSSFRDVHAPWCPEITIIPPGRFLMGASDADDQGTEVERPQHEVTIDSPFGLGRYPVTRGEYLAFCHATDRDEGIDQSYNRWPVTRVSWNDAQAYVGWLSERTGESYRLPSEAEWEYACRAATTTRYSWGDEITPQNANYCWNDEKARLLGAVGGTTEVGKFGANPWGLCDMSGNVLEWVEDAWHDSYVGAPTDGSPWLKGGFPERVVRGGSWVHNPECLRSAYRRGWRADNWDHFCGFRVARSVRA